MWSLPAWAVSLLTAVAAAAAGGIVQYVLRRPESLSLFGRRRAKLERICKLNDRTREMIETLQEGGGRFYQGVLLAAVLLPMVLVGALVIAPTSPVVLPAQELVALLAGLGLLMWMGGLAESLLPSELHPEETGTFSKEELARARAKLSGVAFGWLTVLLALGLSIVATATASPSAVIGPQAAWPVTFALDLFMTLPITTFYYLAAEALDNRAYEVFVSRDGGPLDVWVEVLGPGGKRDTVEGTLTGIGSDVEILRRDLYDERIEWSRIGRVAVLGASTPRIPSQAD